ncbi:hypothetical protein [Paenibacillus aquistagni]|uniref:Uncharacterized protein n=1 Tax=Paenibacillus aquistagni TaxID=1852522 RepID=A0A1X7KAJ5_9BACL|nr:hypothetical protein [Paenibacillus aquistagni]SMG38132.1 hypothetical protein SAMN06295960_2278 [Paenibacillus aquistagni]
MPFEIKDGGLWKNPKKIYSRDSGAWKPVKVLYAKDKTTWKMVSNYLQPLKPIKMYASLGSSIGNGGRYYYEFSHTDFVRMYAQGPNASASMRTSIPIDLTGRTNLTVKISTRQNNSSTFGYCRITLTREKNAYANNLGLLSYDYSNVDVESDLITFDVTGINEPVYINVFSCNTPNASNSITRHVDLIEVTVDNVIIYSGAGTDNFIMPLRKGYSAGGNITLNSDNLKLEIYSSYSQIAVVSVHPMKVSSSTQQVEWSGTGGGIWSYGSLISNIDPDGKFSTYTERTSNSGGWDRKFNSLQTYSVSQPEFIRLHCYSDSSASYNFSVNLYTLGTTKKNFWKPSDIDCFI